MVSRSIKVCALAAGVLAVFTEVFAGAGPTIQGIVPRKDSIEGGRLFRLRGRGFDQLPAGTLGVLFGDVPGTDVEKVGDRDIRGTTPPHPEGVVTVVISIDGAPYPAAGSAEIEYVVGGVPECTTVEECDDLNPCTFDACATTCQNTAADSPDDLTVGAPACAGLTVSPKIGKKFVAGCTKLGQLATAPTEKKRAKFKKKAVKSFTRAATKVGKTQALAGDCATQLGVILDGARAYAEAQ
jgi:hypothetical protein